MGRKRKTNIDRADRDYSLIKACNLHDDCLTCPFIICRWDFIDGMADLHTADVALAEEMGFNARDIELHYKIPKGRLAKRLERLYDTS